MNDSMASVYIMASDSGTLYTGSTIDLEGRVWQHKSGEMPGFTKKYKCHKLVYHEAYGSTDEARLRERQIKGYSRSKKEVLIRSMNPTWFDLAKFWYGSANQPLLHEKLQSTFPSAPEGSLGRDKGIKS